jgi:hypothetical protein
VVHGHQRSPVFPCDHTVSIGPGFGVPYAKNMVPHSPGYIQRGNLLVPRVVQNRLSVLQSGSLHSSVDHRIKKSTQQIRALDSYSPALHTARA